MRTDAQMERDIKRKDENYCMNVIEKKISDIKPYEKNPRKNDDAVPYVAESIKQFGFKVPIVIDKDGIIVAGHTRYKAAKKLKLSTVPCVVADDLTDEQIRAYRLADNKVAEQAEWDFSLLDAELSDIYDIDMTDFSFEFDNEPGADELTDESVQAGENAKIEVKMIFDDVKAWKRYEDTLRKVADEFENVSISVGGRYED